MSEQMYFYGVPCVNADSAKAKIALAVSRAYGRGIPWEIETLTIEPHYILTVEGTVIAHFTFDATVTMLEDQDES